MFRANRRGAENAERKPSWIFSVFLCVLCASAVGSDYYAEDAPLHCVRFVDRNEGWAAGADGVLLHTIDGGAHWERQPVPTKGRINSLKFLTPYFGCAAGREEVQANGSSLGVLLVTHDGGLTWSRIAQGVLPGLQAATFFDDKTGIAAGDGTDRSPGGLYRTRDGGQTWQAVAAPAGAPWLSLSVRHPDHIVLAGAWGRLGTLAKEDFSAADVDPLNGRNINAVAVDRNFAVAVGQGGTVLTSPDSAGRRYGFADLGVPQSLLQQCDFHGVAVLGTHIWVVGRPGTVIFHSADSGKTWQLQPTGQSVPLNAVQFLDADHGWAVGELGVVLATSDGGKTWTPQRRGGQRAAVLSIHANESAVPLDIAAYLGGDGFLVAATTATTADPATAPSTRAMMPLRLQTAIRKSGGAAAEILSGFPMPAHLQSGDRAALVAHWDRTHAGKAADDLLARLVLAIRIWQPEVIMTDFAGSPAETLLVETLQTAFHRAADPTAFAEQIQTLKLTPWQAKKLFTLWDGPGQPHCVVPTTDPNRNLADTPREVAVRVVRLLSEQPLPKTRGLRLLATTLPEEQARRGLMDGILLAPGGTARRAVPETTVADPVAKPMQELKTLLNLSQSGLPQVGDPGTVLARAGTVLDKLPADRGALAVYALGEQYAKSGQWGLARETFALILVRYPEEPCAADACRWLVRYLSSGEARRRYEQGQSISIAQTDFRQADQIPTKEKPFRPGSGVRPLGSSSTSESSAPIQDPTIARRWLQETIALEPKLAACGPLVANDPAIRFCINSAQRQLGEPDPAKAWLRSFLAEQAGTNSHDAWRDAARMELWLMDRNGLPPRPIVHCKRTNQRPHLDGKLDEMLWKDAVPATLKTATGTVGSEYSSEARFAFDDEYLYIAVECKHPADRALPAIEKRSRDADLGANDRVEILLDIDRDYQTYYRLRVDQRGALAEDCWGDPTWNPRWFVAFKSDASGYTAEIAVTLADLTGSIPSPGQSWAVNVVRVLPGRGVTAWSSPADISPRPEGCGALIFGGTK
ncbi:MAG: YCF48-related protein [Gemmataceae bacterium]